MKPMLAAPTDGTNLNYPLLVSPKLDGIRALIIDGVVVSRSLKPIPNKHVQKLFGRPELNGLDGELVVGPVGATNVFQQTTSGVMRHDGAPPVNFFVFDDFENPGLRFRHRLISAASRVKRQKHIMMVPHLPVDNEEQLLKEETSWLQQGFEGLMARDPDGLYKHGRSTLKQGWLLKLKRFEDSEAEVLGYEQLMHNTNEATVNELGYKERSTKKAGKVGLLQLGALKVRDVKTGVEFDIGTGFTQTQRVELWKAKKSLLGQLVKYKFQPTGVKEKPRFPVFLGFRDRRDV